ncbi:MAG: Gfo/Idh/MocA family oxidoreductase [Firmicutes bacterium]|nr:Gfo/Idh/MocA family oxidoreductase [Bacillota bacterium]
MNKLSIVLVGIGGYGNGYVKELLENPGNREYSIVGVVDPFPENAPSLPKLHEINVPVYDSLEGFYKEHRADLAVISSPIHFHYQQTCLALENGSHVLCEKPVTATVQDALKLIEARDEAGKIVGIGYQWSFSKAINALKQDILAGKLGYPKRLKTIVLWPRDLDYYQRGWAGKKQDQQGNWILDSVANNATAHFLHNMFYVIGPTMDSSGKIREVEAELYKANAIENFDTSIIRVITTDDVEILFYASHAVRQSVGPTFYYQFSEAVVQYDETNGVNKEITVHFNDGTVRSYGDPTMESRRKLWVMIDAIINGEPIPCGIEAALTQTMCINGAQESMLQIQRFPDKVIRFDETSNLIYVEGLEQILRENYLKWSMPSKAEVPWAKAGVTLDLTNYTYFPSLASLTR